MRISKMPMQISAPLLFLSEEKKKKEFLIRYKIALIPLLCECIYVQGRVACTRA